MKYLMEVLPEWVKSVKVSKGVSRYMKGVILVTNVYTWWYITLNAYIYSNIRSN